MPDWLTELLRCDRCRAPLVQDVAESRHDLRCSRCGQIVEVRGGIPRFSSDSGSQDVDAVAQRTRASFGYEWTHFHDWKPSGLTNFTDYFEGFDLGWLRGRTVLDAGCGMGRHARQVADYAQTVVAVDFSSAIDQAARNVADRPNVHCVQADLTRLPVADDAFDLVYSMGVLHHLENTEGTLRTLLRAVKPGGRLRVYLYWQRSGVAGVILSLVSLARRVTTRLPFPLLRLSCWVLSVGLCALVVMPYRALRSIGVPVSDRWPLAVYTKYPFTVLYNDQFDRFSAPLEKRYTRAEVRGLLETVGLRDVQVIPRYGWIAEGIKPVAVGGCEDAVFRSGNHVADAPCMGAHARNAGRKCLD